MPDRSHFWSPVPDWSQASIRYQDLSIAAVPIEEAWLVSGNLTKFLDQHGGLPCLGPRDICAGAAYALRLAPDRLLFVCRDDGSIGLPTFGWSDDGIAISDISDGFVLFEVTGRAAPELMERGANYAFDAQPISCVESASVLFAGFKVAVARLGDGWRLHVERPYATALWQWLQHAASEWDKPPAGT
jgi:heterotetrameric sarcosine oxidase gamma subunit